MPDSNDIIYDGYQIDFFYVGQVISQLFGLDRLSYSAFVEGLESAWEIWTVLSLILSFLLIIAIVYTYIRYNQMNALAAEQIATEERLYQELHGTGSANSRWEDVEQHIASDNPTEWKMAIIEADVMLEEALDSAGYAGTTLGEKLKSASPTSFETLDDAWNAHKVRNQIAHGGTDFVLTKKIAQETIVQYRRVFQEFGVI